MLHFIHLNGTPAHSHNIQFLKFMAAILVIFSHSFSIATGFSDNEPISLLTNAQLSGGSLAVAFFFFISGYFITRSMIRLQKAFSFFHARIIRIFPTLVVVILITVFIVGPICTNLPIQDYFQNTSTYRYLLNCLLLRVHLLPGVFTTNPYPYSVNGALWTLPVEFLCYSVCFLLYKLKLLQTHKTWTTIPVAILYVFVMQYLADKWHITLAASLIKPTMLFYMGILCYIYRDYIKLNKVLALTCFIIMLVLNHLGYLSIGIIILLPYMILTLGWGLTQHFSNFSTLGNYSYGIYLCGFPIQQIITTCFNGTMSPYLNTLLSIPLSVLFGCLLYHFIEKPFIKKFSLNTR